MPKLGDRKGNKIWAACVDCGKERWVDVNQSLMIPRSDRCLTCYRKTIRGLGGRVVYD